jgi:hypothetical protein
MAYTWLMCVGTIGARERKAMIRCGCSIGIPNWNICLSWAMSTYQISSFPSTITFHVEDEMVLDILLQDIDVGL